MACLAIHEANHERGYAIRGFGVTSGEELEHGITSLRRQGFHLHSWYKNPKYPWLSLHFRKPIHKWRRWECAAMNLLNSRYWFCGCKYVVPYGLVIDGCKVHDFLWQRRVA